MKIRKDGEVINGVQLSTCYISQREMADLLGKKPANFISYVRSGEVTLQTEEVDGDAVYQLPQAMKQVRELIEKQIRTEMAKTISSVKTKLNKAEKDKDDLKAKLAAAKMPSTQPVGKSLSPEELERKKLSDELLRGEVELNKARLRKFNLTNERIIMQLKELCKQELVNTISPIIARLDQGLTPHAAEVHEILQEMLIHLQNQAAFQELGEEEQELMAEAMQQEDLDGKAPKH